MGFNETVKFNLGARSIRQLWRSVSADASNILSRGRGVIGWRVGRRVALSMSIAAVMTSPAMAKGWFVDGLKGGGQYSVGNSYAPFSQMWMALQKAAPGDTIYVVPSMVYPQLPLMISGTAAASITIQGSNPAQKTQVSGGGVSSGIWIDGNYLIVRNFDVTAPGNYPAISVAPKFHHVTIDNNVVHGAGGNGINTISNDYLTITNNVVYKNASNTTTAFGSGISILGSVDVDQYTGTKIKVMDNVVYGNSNVPNCSNAACLATSQDSDGNGIILDDNQRTQFDHIPYRGHFLVANNVVYKNGGRGIHVFKTDNASIVCNTLYENNQDPYEGFWHPGEVAAVSSGNINFNNNIMYSDGLNGRNLTGTAPNYHVLFAVQDSNDGVGPITFINNLTYNATDNFSYLSYFKNNTNLVSVVGTLFTDPLFENAAQSDFRFKSGSLAFGTANPALTIVGSDFLGAKRTPYASIGAYQNFGP